MAKKSRQQTQRDQMIAAMQPLAVLPEFEKFVETVRQMKDYAIEAMVHTDTVSNERESLCMKGEVRAYLWILETHRAQKEQLEALAADEAQRQTQQ